MLCSCGYIWFEHKPQCNQKAHVGFISLCVFDKQKQHRLGHLSWLSNSGTFHKEELRELLWCQTEVAPCKKMVNVTFFGSKLSSSSGSPPVPALQFPFIHFLLDLPLTPLMAAFGDPATPKGDAKEKRRGDWKKERKKGFPESLHFCTLKVFALAFCISGNELKPVLGKFGGR